MMPISQSINILFCCFQQEDRELLERQLIKVQGVISIVFDATNSRVTLRSRPDLNIESVGQAVRKTQTMRAFLVCKNELGEETLKAIGEAYSEDYGTDGKYFGNGIQ